MTQEQQFSFVQQDLIRIRKYLDNAKNDINQALFDLSVIEHTLGLATLGKVALLNTNIREFDFSTRVRNIFRMMDVKKIRDIVKHNRHDFLRQRTCGNNSIREIEDFLKSKGLEFEMDIDSTIEGGES